MFHYFFAVVSPVHMVIVLMVVSSEWSGFYEIYIGKLPLVAFLVLLGNVSNNNDILLASQRK